MVPSPGAQSGSTFSLLFPGRLQQKTVATRNELAHAISRDPKRAVQPASRYETIQGLARVRSRINRHRPPHSDASFPAPPTHRSTVGAGYSNGPKLSSQHTADTGQAARCGSEDLDGHLRVIHARALSYTHERVVLSTGCLLVGVFDRHMCTATSSAAVEQVPPERARKAASTPTLTPQRRARHIQHSRAARRTTMTPHPHPTHQQVVPAPLKSSPRPVPRSGAWRRATRFDSWVGGAAGAARAPRWKARGRPQTSKQARMRARTPPPAPPNPPSRWLAGGLASRRRRPVGGPSARRRGRRGLRPGRPRGGPAGPTGRPRRALWGLHSGCRRPAPGTGAWWGSVRAPSCPGRLWLASARAHGGLGSCRGLCVA